MIERKFVAQKLKEKQIQDFIALFLSKSGQSRIEIKRTPLGEKIVVYTSRPGLIVGKKGENIKELTKILKTKFNMENPQIEIGEMGNPLLDAGSVADQIAYSLERFGSRRFKFLGYENLQRIMNAGALGAEIVISGKVPSARAKTWRFSAGYLKKSGDISESYVLRSYVPAYLKSGVIGIKVTILPPSVELPDKIKFMSDEVEDEEIRVEEIDGVKVDIEKEEEIIEAKEKEEIKKRKEKEEKTVKKKTTKKSTKKAKKKVKKGDKNGSNKKE
jgi:small subunit ribosomal protein S3